MKISSRLIGFSIGTLLLSACSGGGGSDPSAAIKSSLTGLLVPAVATANPSSPPLSQACVPSSPGPTPIASPAVTPVATTAPTAPPPSPVVSPASLSFGSPTAAAQQFTFTVAGYTGAVSRLADACSGIASVVLSGSSGPSLTATVTPHGVGTCSVALSVDGVTTSVPVTVTSTIFEVR